VGRQDDAGVYGGGSHRLIMLTELHRKIMDEPCILFLVRYNR
jgi:hypothetical protein